MEPYRIEVVNEKGTLPFGPRVFGQAGKDIIAIKLALNLIKDLDGLEASRPDLDPVNAPLDPSIPLDSQRWFDCRTGRPITLMQAATFDESLKTALLAFQIKNQFLITCYLFEKYGIREILNSKRKQRPDTADPRPGGFDNVYYADRDTPAVSEGEVLDERDDERGDEYPQQEYFPESQDGERYDRIILRVITAMLDLFNQEAGNLLEATLAVMHGWRPHTVIGLQGYNHIPVVHENGPVVDIIPEVLAKEMIRNGYGQTIDDLVESGYLENDTVNFNRKSDLETYSVQVNESRNWISNIGFGRDLTDPNFDFRYASLKYNVIYEQQSILYSSAIKVLNNSEIIDSILPSADQREQSLRRLFYPNPFSNPDPFYIDRFTTGHFIETDYVLEECGPFPQHDEQTIIDLENRALKEVLKFYEKPDIWYIPAGDQFARTVVDIVDVTAPPRLPPFNAVQFGNVNPRPQPNHQGLYPTTTRKALKMAIPRYIFMDQQIQAKERKLIVDFTGGERDPQRDQIFNWGLSDEMPSGCDIDYIRKFIDYDDDDRIKGLTVTFGIIEFLGSGNYNIRLPEVKIDGGEHFQLNNEEVRCLEKYETLKAEIQFLKSEFEKEPTPAEKAENFWVLTTDDIISDNPQEDESLANNFQSWREISNIGRTEPLIKFVEYRTPSLRTGQKYRALFHINTEKLNFILDGEYISTRDDGEGTFDPEPSFADLVCADLSGDSERTLDDWRQHARKRRREIVRKLKDAYKEQDSGTGPGEIDLGSFGPFDLNAAAASAGSEFLGVNTLGGDDYTYSKAVLSLPGRGVDAILGSTLGDMNDITTATNEQFQQMAAFDENRIEKLSDEKKKEYRALQRANTLTIPLENLKERIKVVKKDLLESYEIAISEGLEIEPGSNFEPNNEGTLLEEFVSDIESLIKTPTGNPPTTNAVAVTLEKDPKKIMLDFSFIFVYDQSSNGLGPLIGKKVTKLTISDAPTNEGTLRQSYKIDEQGIKNNTKITKTFTRPRTVNYISNILKMTNKSGNRVGMFDDPTAQAFGGWLDDGRGACKDIGIDMDKHLSSRYLSKFTSGLKPKVKKGKTEGESYKKSWWERNFEDPAAQWWKQSEGLHADGQNFNTNENDAFKLLGKVQTVGELYDQFLDKIDLASLLCDYLKCIKMPTVNLKLPNLYLPPFPKVPIYGQYPNQLKFIQEQLGKLMLQFLKSFVSTIIDSLVSPFCEEQLREFIAAGSSAGGPLIDQALTDSLTNLGDAVEKDKAEQAKRAFGNVANIVTGTELCGLMAGQSLDAAGMTMVRRVASEGMQTEMTDDEITNFFQVIGSYIPDNLCQQISQISQMESSKAADCSDVASELQSIRNRLQAGDGDCVESEEIQRVLEKAEKDLKSTENSLREFSGMELGSMMPPSFGMGNPNAIINTLPGFLEKELQTTAENVFMSAKMAYQGTLSTYVPYMSIPTADIPNATNDAQYFTDNELLLEANSTRLALYGAALEQTAHWKKAELLRLELSPQEFDRLLSSSSEYENYSITPEEIKNFIERDERLIEQADLGLGEVETYQSVLEADYQAYIDAGIENLDTTQPRLQERYVTSARSTPGIIFNTTDNNKIHNFLPVSQKEEWYRDIVLASAPDSNYSADFSQNLSNEKSYTLDIYREDLRYPNQDDALSISNRYMELYDPGRTGVIINERIPEDSVVRDVERIAIRHDKQRFTSFMKTFKKSPNGKIFQFFMPGGPYEPTQVNAGGDFDDDGRSAATWLFEARTMDGVLIASRLAEDERVRGIFRERDEPYSTEDFGFPNNLSRGHYVTRYDNDDHNFFSTEQINDAHKRFMEKLNAHMANNFIKLIKEQQAVYAARAGWAPYLYDNYLEGVSTPVNSSLHNEIIRVQNIRIKLEADSDTGEIYTINETKPICSLKTTLIQIKEQATNRIELLKDYGQLDIHAYHAKMLYTMFETEEVDYTDPLSGEVTKRRVHVKYAVTPTIDESGQKYIPFVCRQDITNYASSVSNYLTVRDSQNTIRLVYSPFSRANEGDTYYPRRLSYEEYVRKVNDPENEDLFVLSTIPIATTVTNNVNLAYPFHGHVLGLESTSEIEYPLSYSNAARNPADAMTEEVVKNIARNQGLVTEEQVTDKDKIIGAHYGNFNIYRRMHGYEDKVAINNPNLLKSISDRVRVLSRDLETGLENRPNQVTDKHLLMLQRFIKTDSFIAPEITGMEIRENDVRPTDLKIRLEFKVTNSYSPTIILTQKPAKKNQDRFDVSVESDFHILQTRKNPTSKNNPRFFKSFKYCEPLPDRVTQFNSNRGEKYFSKNEAFSKIVTNSLSNSGISISSLTPKAHFGLYSDTYKDITETIFENIGNGFRESPLFSDDYAQALHKRLAAEATVDQENNCIRNRYGLVSDSVLDFNKIILSDAKKEYYKEAGKPENSAFNQTIDTIGPLEKSLQNLALVAFVRVCLIDTLLKGGLAFSDWDIEPVITEPLYKDYIFHHVKLELDRNRNCKELWRDILERTTGISNTNLALKSLIEEELIKLPDYSKQVFNPNAPDQDGIDWYTKNFIPVSSISEKLGPTDGTSSIDGPGQCYKINNEKVYEVNTNNFIIEEYVSLQGEILKPENKPINIPGTPQFLGTDLNDAITEFEEGQNLSTIQYITTKTFDLLMINLKTQNTQEEFERIINNSTIKHGSRLNLLSVSDKTWDEWFDIHRVSNTRIGTQWPDDIFQFQALNEICNLPSIIRNRSQTDRAYRTWVTVRKTIPNIEPQLRDVSALSIPIINFDRVLDLESCPSAFEPEQPEQGLFNDEARDFVIQKLKEKQEYKDFFEVVFPIKRYMGMYSVMSSSILGGYNKLPTTFESCKQSISFLMKLCGTSPREQSTLIPLQPDQYQKTLTDQFPADPTKASCFSFPGGEFFLQMLEELAKLALQFPSIIFRGIARVMDPAYQEMREHYLNCDLRRIESAAKDNPYGDFGWKSIAWEGTMDDTIPAGLLLKRGESQRNQEKGAYAPIMPIAVLDLVYAITGSWRKLPGRLGKTTLKGLAFIYGGNLPFLDMSRGFNIPCLDPEGAEDWKKGNKYDVGKYGRYGHPLSIFTALALSTPALKSDMMLKNANCRVIKGDEESQTPSEDCEDY